MAANADHPAYVAEVLSVHRRPALEDPVVVVLREIRDEIKALRETVHDVIAGELIEP